MPLYDLIVLGAGSGGIAVAKRAASYGASVLVIEKCRIGGTCVNLGCIPKKITYNLAHILEITKLQGYCLNTQTELFYEKFVERRDEHILKLNTLYFDSLQEANITYLEGYGIVHENFIRVNEKEYKFKHCVLATGSQPMNIYKNGDEAKTKEKETKVLIDGHEHIGDSNDFFSLKKIPKKCVVIGSGYIGIEISFILCELGSEVHIIARNDRLLSFFDDVLGTNILTSMNKKGIKIYFESNIISATKNSVLINQNNQEIEIKDLDFIMGAIGRDCNLEYIIPEISRNGNYLSVNNNFETSLKNIYAIGDLIGPRNMLTPMAIFCGRVLADHLFNTPVDNLVEKFAIYDCVPSIIFSHPPCAFVGISEKEARKTEGVVTIYQSRFRNLFYSICDAGEKENSVFKIVVKDGKVVGLHLYGMGCDEAIQGFALAMKMGATYEDFKRVIPVHPTAAEEVVTMR